MNGLWITPRRAVADVLDPGTEAGAAMTTITAAVTATALDALLRRVATPPTPSPTLPSPTRPVGPPL